MDFREIVCKGMDWIQLAQSKVAYVAYLRLMTPISLVMYFHAEFHLANVILLFA
jgi:hypothetical protein